MSRIIGHRATSKPTARSNEHTGSCGAAFRSRGKLGRHVDKWNAKHELRERRLERA